MLCGLCSTTTSKPQQTTTSTKAVFVTWEEFQKAFTLTGYPIPLQNKYENFVKNAEESGGITTKRELAMFLAQIIWESAGLQYVEEIACKNNGCPGNYQYWDDYPGARYFGRGYIQLSWSYNYKAASLALYKDLRLYINPNLVAESDEISWAVSFWFWKVNVHTQPGITDGIAYFVNYKNNLIIRIQMLIRIFWFNNKCNQRIIRMQWWCFSIQSIQAF